MDIIPDIMCGKWLTCTIDMPITKFCALDVNSFVVQKS